MPASDAMLFDTVVLDSGQVKATVIIESGKIFKKYPNGKPFSVPEDGRVVVMPLDERPTKAMFRGAHAVLRDMADYEGLLLDYDQDTIDYYEYREDRKADFAKVYNDTVSEEEEPLPGSMGLYTFDQMQGFINYLLAYCMYHDIELSHIVWNYADVRKQLEYSQWRWVCVKCGLPNEKDGQTGLVHHHHPIVIGMGRDRKATDPDNEAGNVPLCGEHHAEIHYGVEKFEQKHGLVGMTEHAKWQIEKEKKK